MRADIGTSGRNIAIRAPLVRCAVTALGEAVASTIGTACPDFIQLERQRYPSHFVKFEGTFDDYLGRSSAKTRSTLKPNRTRSIEQAGDPTIRKYHRFDSIQSTNPIRRQAPFFRISIRRDCQTLVCRTGTSALAEMCWRLSTDMVRAYSCSTGAGAGTICIFRYRHFVARLKKGMFW